MRTAEINRKTKETDIKLSLNIDGNGTCKINSGCGFFDHMLELFAVHGCSDLTVDCAGDTQVDCHHSVEDIGIALGAAFKKALGNCAGIKRYGNMILPMDEALMLCALDISGRGYCSCNFELPVAKLGTFDTELAEEFFVAFSRECGITLHFKKLAGKNTHHILEAAFKSFARALSVATDVDEKRAGSIPSSKGVI